MNATCILNFMQNFVNMFSVYFTHFVGNQIFKRSYFKLNKTRNEHYPVPSTKIAASLIKFI